jgi:hypothetical protein
MRMLMQISIPVDTGVGHMDRMIMHMESMGQPGMMGPGMGGPPPSGTKPE